MPKVPPPPSGHSQSKENANPFKAVKSLTKSSTEPLFTHCCTMFNKYTSLPMPISKIPITVPSADVLHITHLNRNASVPSLPTSTVGFNYTLWAGRYHLQTTQPIAFLYPTNWTKLIYSGANCIFDKLANLNLSHQEVVFVVVQIDAEWALVLVVQPSMIGGQKDVMEGNQMLPYTARALAQAACGFQQPFVLVFSCEDFNMRKFCTGFEPFLQAFVSANRRDKALDIPY